MAGAVNGSPLVDAYGRVYGELAARLPSTACSVTDRGELASQNMQVRLAWLAGHWLPAQPRDFSLVAAPTDDRVSAALPGAQPSRVGNMNALANRWCTPASYRAQRSRRHVRSGGAP